MAAARIESLQLVQAACWQQLQHAAAQREHAWHVMTLATVASAEAGGVDARSVVLRGADPLQKQLVFYCDSRSPKAQQLRQHAQAVLVAWSAALSWQLRIRVSTQVLTDGLDVSSRWARVKMSRASQDYLSTLPPGTPLDRREPERGTREHFAVVQARVQAIDWLELHDDGHRRAAFDADGARWLVP